MIVNHFLNKIDLNLFLNDIPSDCIVMYLNKILNAGFLFHAQHCISCYFQNELAYKNIKINNKKIVMPVVYY